MGQAPDGLREIAHEAVVEDDDETLHDPDEPTTMTARKKTAAERQGRSKGPSAAQLDKMIAEALVDAHDESEAMTGFYTMIEDNLAAPFQTQTLGVEVTVEGVHMTDDEQIVALCSRGSSTQTVPILDLPLPDPPPEGSDWILAFRRWARGGR